MEGKEAAYIRQWEQKHGKGKWAYLLLSPLIWGGISVFTYYTFKLVLKGSFSWNHLLLIFSEHDFWKGWILLSFFIFSLEGLLWQLAYRKYRSFKRKQTAH